MDEHINAYPNATSDSASNAAGVKHKGGEKTARVFAKYAIKIVDQNLLLFDAANAPVTLDDRLETAFVSTFQLD